MDLNQDPTLGSSACDHKTFESKPEKRVCPESNSTPNTPVSSCEAKRLKSDMLAAAVETVTGAQSKIKKLKDKVAKQTSKTEQCTAELTEQPNELQSDSLKLKKERDFHKNRQQQAKALERRMLAKIMVILKEVTNLREFMNAQEQPVRDCYSDKVLLEQQLHVLRARVDALQPLQTELQDVKAKLASMESYLEELQVAECPHDIQNACPQYILNPAVNLNISAASIQPRLQLTQPQTPQRQFPQWQFPQRQFPQPQFLQPQFPQPQFPQPQFPQPQFPQLSEEMAPVRENKVFTVRKDPNGPIQKLQNRLQLVTRERDSYKDILEKKSVENATKMLKKFEDIVAMNARNSHTKLESVLAESSKLREEAEALKLENDKLVAERDALLAKLECTQSQTEATVQDGSGSCAGPEEVQQLKEQQ